MAARMRIVSDEGSATPRTHGGFQDDQFVHFFAGHQTAQMGLVTRLRARLLAGGRLPGRRRRRGRVRRRGTRRVSGVLAKSFFQIANALERLRELTLEVGHLGFESGDACVAPSVIARPSLKRFFAHI
jgi:hypothetical protein